MTSYTKTLWEKTQADFEKALSIFQFGTQIIYILYLISSLFTANKIWVLQLSLLILSISFFVFDIIATRTINNLKNEKISIFGKKRHKKKVSEAKHQKRRIAKYKTYVSHIIKLFVLAYAFYPIIVYPDNVHPLSIMITTFMVIVWLLQTIFEILHFIVSTRISLFMKAIEADKETLAKPVNFVKDTVKKAFKKENDKPEVTKEREYLDGLVQTVREEKAQKKAEVKAQRSEKLSSWLDSHLHKKGKKKAKNTEPKTEAEAQVVEAVTTETIEKS